jgi:hypothetical protein
VAKSKTSTTGSLPPAAVDMEQRVVQFAEQLGWWIGTVQAKSEGWLDREALKNQVERIHDGAAELMAHLSANAETAVRPRASKAATGRGKKASGKNSGASSAKAVSAPKPSRGAVDGPGKRHRPAPPSARGVKHSDERIAKTVLARSITRRPRT